MAKKNQKSVWRPIVTGLLNKFDKAPPPSPGPTPPTISNQADRINVLCIGTDSIFYTVIVPATTVWPQRPSLRCPHADHWGHPMALRPDWSPQGKRGGLVGILISPPPLLLPPHRDSSQGFTYHNICLPIAQTDFRVAAVSIFFWLGERRKDGWDSDQPTAPSSADPALYCLSPRKG